MSDNNSFARRAGVIAGGAVLLAAAGAGFVYWEGMQFDDAFDDFAERAAKLAEPYGVSVEAVNEGGGFAHRNISITLSHAEAALRWTGRTEFGFGTVSELAFDKEFGFAPSLKELGLEGYEDKVTLRSSITGKDIRFEWQALPFNVNHAGVVCTFDGLTLSGSSGAGHADFTAPGMTCRDFESTAKLGTVQAAYDESKDGQTRFSFALKDMSMDNVRASEFTGSVLTAKTTPEGADADRFDVSYTFSLKNLEEEGKLIFNDWRTALAVRNVDENLMLAAASSSTDPDMLMKYIATAIRNDGLLIDLDDMTLERGEHKAVLTGRYGGDAKKPGAFAFSLDRGLISDQAMIDDEAAKLLQAGFLKEEEGRLVSHIEINEDGTVTANGKPL